MGQRKDVKNISSDKEHVRNRSKVIHFKLLLDTGRYSMTTQAAVTNGITFNLKYQAQGDYRIWENGSESRRYRHQPLKCQDIT